MASLQERIREEVDDLHRALVEWFTGAIANDDAVFEARLAGRLHPDFHLLDPGGVELPRDTLLGGLWQGHGSNPDFRIQIRNVQLRVDGGKYALATYEEWQRHAKVSHPPDNARTGSVLFQVGDRLLWRHLHETWVPKDVMDAGPYDF